MVTTIHGATVALSPQAGPVDVVVEGGTITGVEPFATIRPRGEVVDATGHYLVPGLVDAHLHLTGPEELHQLVRSGVTTGVDLGTHPDELVEALRGLVGGADVLSAGAAASAPGGTQTTVMGLPEESAVAGPGDVQRWIEWRVAAHGDLVKIIIEDPSGPVPALDVETIRAIVAAAHARGLMTFAHVVTQTTFELALDGGVDVLTHAPADRPLDPAIVQCMVEQGTVCCPTLVMMRAIITQRADSAGPGLDFGACVESVRRMHEAGVPILAGTDANATPVAPVPHGTSLHDELALLCEAGLTPREALLSATKEPARRLHLDDRGRIEPGARADLVLVEEDPLVGLATLREPVAVWVGGTRATL